MAWKGGFTSEFQRCSIRSVKLGKRQENSVILEFLIFKAFSKSLSFVDKLLQLIESFLELSLSFLQVTLRVSKGSLQFE